MLEQPESPSTSQTKQQIFDHYLYRLQSEIHTILSAEPDYEERVRRLETDLEVFKRACFAAENDKRRLDEENSVLRERLEVAEAHRSNTEKRIVCLIDGDGTVFSAELMSKGQDGGRLAAKQLSESVHFHLTSVQPCRLWTYVFFNKRGLLDALAAAGGEYAEARERFGEFMSGFNQSSERFVMADIGSGEGATDSKIKAHLDFHARSQDTYKIVFGGCHDNSYLHHLHSLQLTSAYREKLVLLPGCTEMASEIDKLQLPSLVIPNLFVPDIAFGNQVRQSSPSGPAMINGNTAKFGPPPGLTISATPSSGGQTIVSPSGSITPPPPPPYPRQSEPTISDVPEAISCKPEGGRSIVLSPLHPSTPDCQQRVILGHASGPVSYRPVALPWSQPRLHAITDLRDNHMGSNSNEIRSTGKQRRINHAIPLSQHEPPPCTLFYLASNGCKHGPDCRFGHDYVLDDDDYELLRLNAKKVPCPAANRGEACVFGDDCCYGHTCPFLTRCHYFKQNKCKFAGGKVVHTSINITC
ncbi:hypothetical protein M0805_004328 [Coniferiporia weirii]|nr:hypothetical protein M0805_004328 [Coniferiporia weirii]